MTKTELWENLRGAETPEDFARIGAEIVEAERPFANVIEEGAALESVLIHATSGAMRKAFLAKVREADQRSSQSA